MAATPTAAPTTPRFNPFVFPPDTTFRFVLLMISVITASLFIYNSLHLYLSPQTQQEQLARCGPLAARFQEALAGARESEAAYQEFLAADQAYRSCNAPYLLAKAGWQLGGVALLLVLAGAIYWLFPIWTIRRAGLQPLTPEDHPELLAYLETLCHEAGLKRTPHFLWNPFNATSGGLAFGRRGRYYVMLTGGLVHQFVTDRAAFRAVVLHELAHLRNADVDKTYFAVAIALAFVLVALAPPLIYLIWSLTIGEIWLFFQYRRHSCGGALGVGGVNPAQGRHVA